MAHAAPVLFPTLPPEEANARARELDAALHRAMRERGELLIDPKHLELAALALDCCAVCTRPVSCRDPIALINGVLYHAVCR
jgi:hypothetical protein